MRHLLDIPEDLSADALVREIIEYQEAEWRAFIITLERLPAHILESFLACLEKNVQQAGTQLCTSWVKMRRSGEIRSENPQSR